MARSTKTAGKTAPKTSRIKTDIAKRKAAKKTRGKTRGSCIATKGDNSAMGEIMTATYIEQMDASLRTEEKNRVEKRAINAAFVAADCGHDGPSWILDTKNSMGPFWKTIKDAAMSRWQRDLAMTGMRAKRGLPPLILLKKSEKRMHTDPRTGVTGPVYIPGIETLENNLKSEVRRLRAHAAKKAVDLGLADGNKLNEKQWNHLKARVGQLSQKANCLVQKADGKAELITSKQARERRPEGYRDDVKSNLAACYRLALKHFDKFSDADRQLLKSAALQFKVNIQKIHEDIA